MNQTPYSKNRDAITLILFAALVFILVATFTSCSSERKGCDYRGYVGYKPSK